MATLVAERQLCEPILTPKSLSSMVRPMRRSIERRHFLNTLLLAGLAPFVASIVKATEPLLPGKKRRLNCRWQERKHGSYICDLNQTGAGPFDFTQLSINGQPQILARFPDAQPSGLPNYTKAVRFLPKGSILPDFEDLTGVQNLAALEFDPATFTNKRWGNPEVAILCLKKSGGDQCFPVRAIDYDENLIWIEVDDRASQPARDGAPEFYVENVYEELNLPHEWYLDRHQGYLFYRPPEGLDMNSAIVEVSSQS
jgi:hypothetical protein